MSRAFTVLALAAIPWVLTGAETQARLAPAYSASSIVNLASGRAEDLAPNTLVALSGKDLAAAIRVRRDEDIAGTTLPVSLPGTGTSVSINGLLASVEYVSPAMVIFLVPPELPPGPVEIAVMRNSWYGPVVKVLLKAVAPALFVREQQWLLARHSGSGEWIDESSPAAPGETVILYATGLGATAPPQVYRQIQRSQAPLQRNYELMLTVNGIALDPGRLVYAGGTPGSPGVYEIRLRLPEAIEEDPEIRVVLGTGESQSGLRLPLKWTPPQPGAAAARSTQ